MNPTIRISGEFKKGYMKPFNQEGLDLHELWLLVDEVAVGYASVFRKAPANVELAPGHIGVWVQPEFQGLGFGNRLMKQALLIAAEYQHNPIYLVTHEHNWSSRNMMRSCGAELETHYKHQLGNLVRYIVIP